MDQSYRGRGEFAVFEGKEEWSDGWPLGEKKGKSTSMIGVLFSLCYAKA